MNPKKLKLLNSLRANSREKLTTVSKQTGVPISTLFDLLKDLQKTVISKNTVILDFSIMGLHSHAYIFLKVPLDMREKLRIKLLADYNVNTVYKMNNCWDFVIETIHKNVRDLSIFIDSIEEKYCIENKEVHYLVKEVKKEGFQLLGNENS